MRKYLVGMLIGVALTIASSAFADDFKSLIGAKIQGEYPVLVDGEQLEKFAVVINGTSYLPNRVLAERIGYEVSFDPYFGIAMNKKEVNPTETKVVYTSEYFDEKIASLKKSIGMYKDAIEHLKKGDPIDTFTIGKYEEAIVKYEEFLKAAEQQKAALSQ